MTQRPAAELLAPSIKKCNHEKIFNSIDTCTFI